MERWRTNLIKVNKERKRRGDPKLTFDEYVNQIHGIKPKKEKMKHTVFVPPKTVNDDRIEEIKKFKSVLSNSGDCTLPNKEHTKEAKSKYTIAPAFNKGGYQVIPSSDIKHIGK